MGTREDIQSIIQQPFILKQEEPVAPVVEDVVEPVVVEQAVEPVVKTYAEMSDDELRDEAKQQGWKEDFDGPNKRSAKEFLELGERRATLLAKDKKRLEVENKGLREYNDKVRESAAQAMAKLKTETDKRIAELEEKKVEARENLDTDKLEKVINEQNDLKKARKDLDAPLEMPIDPALQIWADNNKDFVQKMESDKVLARYGESVALEMRDELLPLTPTERFNRIRDRVQEEMAHKFVNPNQDQAPRTLTMNRTQTPQKPNPNKITIASLPAEEKAGYDLIVRAKRFKSPEERKSFDDRFLENYKQRT